MDESLNTLDQDRAHSASAEVPSDPTGRSLRPLISAFLPASVADEVLINVGGYQRFAWDPVRFIQTQTAAHPLDFALRLRAADQIASALAPPRTQYDNYIYCSLVERHSGRSPDLWYPWLPTLHQRVADLVVCVAELETDTATLHAWLAHPDALHEASEAVRSRLSASALAHWDRVIQLGGEHADSCAEVAAIAVCPVLEISHSLRELPILPPRPPLKISYDYGGVPPAGQMYMNAASTHASQLRPGGRSLIGDHMVRELTGRPIPQRRTSGLEAR